MFVSFLNSILPYNWLFNRYNLLVPNIKLSATSSKLLLSIWSFRIVMNSRSLIFCEAGAYTVLFIKDELIALNSAFSFCWFILSIVCAFLISTMYTNKEIIAVKPNKKICSDLSLKLRNSNFIMFLNMLKCKNYSYT